MGAGLDRDEGVARCCDRCPETAPRRVAGAAPLHASSSATRGCACRLLLAAPLALARWSPTSARSSCSSSRRSGGSTRSRPRSSTTTASRTSSTLWESDVYRDDRAPDDRDRGGGDRHRRACSPSRSPSTWRRSRRRARGALLVVAILHAALGELPREGLRLADDPPGERDPELGARAVRARRARASATSPTWLVFSLPLAAVHDPADLRGARADPGLAARGVGRPRRQGRADVPPRDPAARASRRSSPARSSRSR